MVSSKKCKFLTKLMFLYYNNSKIITNFKVKKKLQYYTKQKKLTKHQNILFEIVVIALIIKG